MTHAQWIKLTPEEQRIKVARLCGWKKHNKEQAMFWAPTNGLNPKTGKLDIMPDYLNDLNAMHEVLKIMRPMQTHNFEVNLMDVVAPEVRMTIQPFELIQATAAQRAEAFVITMEGIK